MARGRSTTTAGDHVDTGGGGSIGGGDAHWDGIAADSDYATTGA